MQVFSYSKSYLLPHLSPNPSSNPNPVFNSSTSICSSLFSLPRSNSLRFSHKLSSSTPLHEEIKIGKDLKPEQNETEEQVLIARRPMMDLTAEEEAIRSLTDSPRGDDVNSSYSSKIDEKMSEIAKKLPIFEPERLAPPAERPLQINLELALYRAKEFTRLFEFDKAEELLLKCMPLWPEDGRIYVALGKVFVKQLKYAEAKTVYERGCQATQGENTYIWQCWAVLESKAGNTKRARELFDASIVADKKHAPAWHGWAVLEMKKGNLKRARYLLRKGLQFCGGNEYIYQTLALLEVKSKRYEHARHLFQRAVACNPKSCASWLAWAQMEIEDNNNSKARELFEEAIQASPKNRFAWHVWAVFEANQGNIEKARKLLKVGYALNPRDPVLLQSLALIEYRHTSANAARLLFQRASKIDPRHQPVWMAWGWMEWKEGNISTARELYQRVLSIDTTNDSAARCFQAWGVLEQRIGNLEVARRLFRSSLNINSQSYITWMTWASLEERRGNSIRAEEIRNLYLQQRTEIVDDPLWVMGLLDIFDPAMGSIKRMLKWEQPPDSKSKKGLSRAKDQSETGGESSETREIDKSDFDLDAFLKRRLSVDPSKLDELFEDGHKELAMLP
ncbi:psbB mRNA maturation factor Mbb1 [Carex littledalei]|uniref:PsbB mRNA maturation factor Mbb1 n=1 Tax=Carex littledalei TaxID=544730 RepID=A0A833QN58_9POAL|nr:psbB mRNA maturation factor Mbb1 [Carex littledalei]